MKENIIDKLKVIMADLLSLDVVEDFNDESNLLTDFGFDSIMLVQFVAEIEDVFNITFKDEDMDIEKIYNVSLLLECIEQYIA